MKITLGLNRMCYGIGIFAIILLMVTMILFPFLWGIIGMDSVLVMGIILITASKLYFKYVFSHCTFTVPADRAWIISDPFVSESAAFQHTFTGFRNVLAQTEFQAGFHWKYPWEKPSLEIDMSRKATLQQRPDEVYTLRDGKLVIIRWRIFWGPLNGSLVNFVRTRPPEIEMRLRDRVETFLQGTVGEDDKIGYGRQHLDHFRVKFEQKFGPPEQIDAEERELGIWTGSPQIIDIDLPRASQEITSILDAATKAVVESGGKMTYDDARAIILSAKASGANVDILEMARAKKLTS